MNQRRSLILFILLAATAIAAYFAPEHPDVVAPISTGSVEGTFEAKSVAVGTTGLRDLAAEPGEMPLLLKRDKVEKMPLLFGADAGVRAATMNAMPVEKPAPLFMGPPPPPPPPQAPPLPFNAFGRYIENGVVTVFLRYGDRSLVARVGEKILGQYLIEAIDERAVAMVYLPLNQRQILDIRLAP